VKFFFQINILKLLVWTVARYTCIYRS